MDFESEPLPLLPAVPRGEVKEQGRLVGGDHIALLLRGTDSMSRVGIHPKQDRVLARCRRLQARRHLEELHRIDPGIIRSRDQQHRRVSRSVLHMQVGVHGIEPVSYTHLDVYKRQVRTTAYFDGEADHLKYTNHNALGTCLQTGLVNSAAADWARWPAGTMFRILQNGKTYVVDDYGWDLAGTNTIDIYQPCLLYTSRCV